MKVLFFLDMQDLCVKVCPSIQIQHSLFLSLSPTSTLSLPPNKALYSDVCSFFPSSRLLVLPTTIRCSLPLSLGLTASAGHYTNKATLASFTCPSGSKPHFRFYPICPLLPLISPLSYKIQREKSPQPKLNLVKPSFSPPTPPSQQQRRPLSAPVPPSSFSS